MQLFMKRLLIMAFVAIFAVGCGSTRTVEEQPAQGSVTTLSVEEFAKVIARKNVRLIDVRTPGEYADGHLQGAENIDVKNPNFAEQSKGVKGAIAVYCAKGVRSLNAANQLAAKGCTVYNLSGGIVAWRQAGKPVTK